MTIADEKAGSSARPATPTSNRVVDVDVHVADNPKVIAPYCTMPWRKSLEISGNMPYRHLDIPGYSPTFRIDPAIPGGQPRIHVSNAKQMREELDAIAVTDAILLPDNLLHFAPIQNIDYAVAVMQAYNRWLTTEWLTPGNGLWAAIVAGPQDPDASVREIETYATHPQVKAIFLPTAAVNPLWGHRKYERVMAAAAAAGLPIMFHSVTLISPAFPHNQDQFENQYARQILTHPFSMMSNLVSLMHTGVPVRHPNLKVVFTEAGISWVPHIMWRLDRYWQEFRRMVPFFEEAPSFYMKRQMWYATQPVEEPDQPMEIVEQVRHAGGAERIMFASDWPHHDFDHPRALRRWPLQPEERRKIMYENAEKAFNLPPLPEKAAKP